MPSAPKPTGGLKRRRTILRNVFVEHDARLGLAQPRQRGLAVEEPEIAQVLTIVLDKVKGLEDCRTRSLASAQILEPRQAVWPQHNRLAVDGEAPGLDPLRGRRDHEQLSVQS
jgi:hypothetical protein